MRSYQKQNQFAENRLKGFLLIQVSNYKKAISTFQTASFYLNSKSFYVKLPLIG
jgi:hypothetical protein